MHQIKLLYIITKLELGGAQKQLLYCIYHLKEKFEIWLVTQDRGVLLPEAYSISGIKLKPIPFLVRFISPVKDIKAFFSLYKLIKREKFDIVHTHSSKAGILGRWAAKLAGVQVIFHTVHGFAFHSKQNWLGRNFYIYIERLTAKITTRLIAVSDEIIEKGLKAGIGRLSQYKCIYYGVEQEKFSLKTDKLLIKEHLGLNGRIIGTISCFKPQKALQDFIRAAALVKEEFPRAAFLIIGDGYLRPRFEKLSKKLGLKGNLVFAGRQSDIPKLLAAMEIFVLSSLWEGMPISILEAMAAGLPVVATAVDGIREIVISEQTGFLVQPGDYQGLAYSIVRLLKNKSLAQRFGRNGQEFISKGLFEPQRMLSDTIRLYQESSSSYNTQNSEYRL